MNEQERLDASEGWFVYFIRLARRFKGSGIGGLPLVKWGFRVISRRARIEPLIINRYKMYLDKNDSLSLVLTPDYEPDNTALCKQILKTGNVVVDVGAHIGYYSLLAANEVGKTGRVYAFEADPKNFAVLKKNILANKYESRIHAFCKIVSSEGGLGKLYMSHGTSGGNSIYPHHNMNTFISGEKVSLDQSLKGVKVDFMKIDVEGAELDVLKGGKNILRQKEIKILLELLNPRTINKDIGWMTELVLFLDEEKFRLYFVELHGQLKRMMVKQIIEYYKGANAESKSLFCVR